MASVKCADQKWQGEDVPAPHGALLHFLKIGQDVQGVPPQQCRFGGTASDSLYLYQITSCYFRFPQEVYH